METTRRGGTHRSLVAVQATEADAWLVEHYHLPAPQRWQVRDAVVYGRELPDPALRRAAYDLAGCALRGEIRLGRALRAAAILVLIEGAAVIALAIVLATMVGGLATAAALLPLLLGVRWLARGTNALRTAREGPARARRLNA